MVPTPASPPQLARGSSPGKARGRFQRGAKGRSGGAGRGCHCCCCCCFYMNVAIIVVVNVALVAVNVVEVVYTVDSNVFFVL